jgi:hypothetical protein
VKYGSIGYVRSVLDKIYCKNTAVSWDDTIYPGRYVHNILAKSATYIFREEITSLCPENEVSRFV